MSQMRRTAGLPVKEWLVFEMNFMEEIQKLKEDIDNLRKSHIGLQRSHIKLQLKTYGDESNEIYKEEKRVKCIYCKKPIHIDRFAGITKDGMFCNGFPCLMELSKVIDNKEEDDFNLADDGHPKDLSDRSTKDIKTFIQKTYSVFSSQPLV